MDQLNSFNEHAKQLVKDSVPITQKCHELNSLIKERFACRNVLGQFKPIVENIFASQGGWNLKTLTRNTNTSDYDSVVTFLHPDGILFAMIRSLMTETSVKYEFPISQFPQCIRTMIENGTSPPYFANKMTSSNFAPTSLIVLNAFEFYILHFGLHVLDNSSTAYDTSGPINNEPAYFTLLKIYLNYFVPIESIPRGHDGHNFLTQSGNHQSSIWQSLSSTTTSILNLATSYNQNSNNMESQGSHNLPSLFKASIFQPNTPFNQNITTNYLSMPGTLLYGQGEHLMSLEWRCSTFLLILTELWFGNIPAPKTNYILRTSAPLDDLSVSNIQPYSANVDQMTSVRIVIKHLHSFSNSFTYNPVSYANNQGLADIKQSIWTSKYPLQKRLYTFLKVAINRWPMDYTFRQPLEAWLSYIQPWRYVKNSSEFSNDFEDFDGTRNASLIDAPCIDNHWRNFISDNLLYYSVIFSLLINRLLQLDLSSSRNALMLFRVIKVYSQPGFLVLLREAEEAVIRNNLEQSMNISASKSPFKISSLNRSTEVATPKAKLLAPSFLASGRVSSPRTRIGALEHHLMNLESDSEFDYVSLFSPQTKRHLSKLLSEILRSRMSIKQFAQSVEVRSKLRNRGWLDSIMTFLYLEDISFESKDEREMYRDKIQAEEYLKFATNKITQCFDVQLPEVDLQTRSVPSLTSSQQAPKIFFNY